MTSRMDKMTTIQESRKKAGSRLFEDEIVSYGWKHAELASVRYARKT